MAVTQRRFEVGRVWLRAGAASVALFAFGACQTAPLDAIVVGPTTLGIGLIAHYTFDEGNGTIVYDHSGNNRTGFLTNGSWITNGKFGGALHFDGTTTAVVQTFPFAASSGFTGFSVSVWFQPAALAFDAGPPNPLEFQTILSTELVHMGGWEINLGVNPPLIQTAFPQPMSVAYTYVNSLGLTPGQWIHIVSVFDASNASKQTLSLYINDALVPSTVVSPNPILPGTMELFMGYWQGTGRLLVGDLDDVAIYNRPLDSKEVIELGQRTPPDPSDR